MSNFFDRAGIFQKQHCLGLNVQSSHPQSSTLPLRHTCLMWNLLCILYTYMYKLFINNMRTGEWDRAPGRYSTHFKLCSYTVYVPMNISLSQPGNVRAASSKAVAVSEEDFSSVTRSAAAASSTPEPTAPGTVSAAPATATAATTPPHAWAWENRDGLLVTARRILIDMSESPETAQDSEVGGDLNLSASSWTQDREDDCMGRESPPTAAKTETAPDTSVPGPVPWGETSPTAEEGGQKRVQPAFQPPPPPPPW